MAKQTKNISSYFASTTSPTVLATTSAKKRKIVEKEVDETKPQIKLNKRTTTTVNDGGDGSNKKRKNVAPIASDENDNENDGNINIQSLRDRWTSLYAHQLPEAAAAKSPSQPIWPVQLNHCFARIILDNVVGEGVVPWMERVKAPAVKNLSEDQLKGCIEMAEGVLEGKVDLVEMDGRSLDVRGKKRKGKKKDLDLEMGREVGGGREDDGNVGEEEEEKNKKKKGSRLSEVVQSAARDSSDDGGGEYKDEEATSWKRAEMTGDEDDEALMALVNSSSKTPYQKKVLLLLLQVPAGEFFSNLFFFFFFPSMSSSCYVCVLSCLLGCFSPSNSLS